MRLDISIHLELDKNASWNWADITLRQAGRITTGFDALDDKDQYSLEGLAFALDDLKREVLDRAKQEVIDVQK